MKDFIRLSKNIRRLANQITFKADAPQTQGDESRNVITFACAMST